MATPGGTPNRNLLSTVASFFSPSTTHPPSRSPSPSPPPDPEPLDADEIADLRRKEAQRIDDIIEEQNAAERYKELTKRGQKLVWRPDILPDDDAYIAFRDRIGDEIMKKSLAVVLEENFDAGQRCQLESYNMINPSDAVKRVRDENTAAYKAALSEAGAFAGEMDNLRTKLTMMKFGLPIEPLTYNNVTCLIPGYLHDTDNLPDPPMSPARVQRIMYSEKPLEFLDLYGDRSHGFPILRRPKQRPALLPGPPGPPGPMTSDEDSFWDDSPTMLPGPPDLSDPMEIDEEGYYDSESEVSMRGGAGPPPGGSGDCYLYSYWGNIAFSVDEAEDDASQARFDQAVRHLFQLAPNDNWECHLDVLEETNTDHEVQEISSTIISNVDVARDWLTGASIRNKLRPGDRRHPFVRPITGNATTPAANTTGAPKPTHYKPQDSWHDIVTLAYPRGGASVRYEAYWRIPDAFPEERNFGMNNINPGYSQALRILFGENHPAVGPIEVGPRVPIPGIQNAMLGWGAGEASISHFHRLTATNGTDPALTPDFFPLYLDLQDVPLPGVDMDDQIGLHLIGSNQEGHIAKNPVAGRPASSLALYNQILRMLRDGPDFVGVDPALMPVRVRIWPSDAARHSNSASFLAELWNPATPVAAFPSLTTEAEAALQFKTVLERIQNDPSPTLWFRVEWNLVRFQLYVTENGVPDANDFADWNLKDLAVVPPTDVPHNIEDFTNWVESNLRAQGADDPYPNWTWNGDRRIVLVDENPREGACAWIINGNTTEEEFRLFVFDWFQSPEILILLDQDSDVWTISPRSNDDWWAEITWKQTQRVLAATPATPAITPTTFTRFNRSRMLAATAQRAKTEKWDPWMTEQHRQDNLQRTSWIQDQSVIEPGQRPEPPIYGESRELLISVGASMPTVYGQRLTPTDIAELAAENQRYRNAALDRVHQCQICNVTIASYNKAEMSAHYQEHLTQLQAAGKCPICGKEVWSIMTQLQRSDHILEHCLDNSGKFLRAFWDTMECPLCDKSLQSMINTDVLDHLASHVPGALQYCDRCGLRESLCTLDGELDTHFAKCINANPKLALDPPYVWCPDCGKDITNPNAAEVASHNSLCTLRHKLPSPYRKVYHSVCSLDMTNYKQHERDAHITRCVPPRGPEKTYCRRCGIRLEGLTPAQLSDHVDVCSHKPQPVEDLKRRFKELQARESLNITRNSEINSRIAWLDAREAAVDDRETKLAVQIAGIQPSPTDLGVCPVPGCSHVIGHCSRDDLFAHLITHAAGGDLTIQFQCPLNAGCLQQIVLNWESATVANPNGSINLNAITNHYAHKAPAAPPFPPPPVNAGNPTRAEYAALVAWIQALQDAHNQIQPTLNNPPPAGSGGLAGGPPGPAGPDSPVKEDAPQGRSKRVLFLGDTSSTYTSESGTGSEHDTPVEDDAEEGLDFDEEDSSSYPAVAPSSPKKKIGLNLTDPSLILKKIESDVDDDAPPIESPRRRSPSRSPPKKPTGTPATASKKRKLSENAPPPDLNTSPVKRTRRAASVATDDGAEEEKPRAVGRPRRAASVEATELIVKKTRSASPAKKVGRPRTVIESVVEEDILEEEEEGYESPSKKTPGRKTSGRKK